MIDSTLLCYISGWVVTYLSRWTAINICQALCPCEKKEPRTTSATLFSTIVVKFSLSNDVVKFVGSSVLEYSSLSDFHSRFTMSGLSVYNYIPIFYLVKFSLSIVDSVKFVSS